MNYSNHNFMKGASGSPITINDQRSFYHHSQMSGTYKNQTRFGFGNSTIQNKLTSKVYVPQHVGIRPVLENKQNYQKREKFMSPQNLAKKPRQKKRNHQMS